jgi:adenylate cyclase class 2
MKEYEVENKFPVLALEPVEQRLRALGATPEPGVRQLDRYYEHPARDFAQTDEALRIRCVGDENRFTYKGPKIDATTKTRREIELPLAPGADAAATAGALLEALGFRLVAEVAKLRRNATFEWQGRAFHAALDDVDGLGFFVELETAADETDLEEARAALASLVAQLELARPERRSYLELLLHRLELE